MTRPVRPVSLGPRDIVVERRADGCVLLCSQHALGPYPRKLTERLDFWAAQAPGRLFLAQRDGAGWRTLSYGQARERARRVGQYLLEQQLSAERPLVVLSGNDLEHALLELGALYAGVPYTPVAPAYSLASTEFGKLRSIFELMTPGLVYASDRGAFRKAIDAVLPRGVEVIFEPKERPVSAALDAAHGMVGPDTIAKFLFTSGSTGAPKAVINTQRMWCSNQKLAATMFAYFQDEPPVLVEWAPWHHTAAGNKGFGMALYNGGSYYIDEGKPLPGAIEATVKNLREIAPTWYFNVPRGFESLLPYLKEDASLRQNFFSRLKVLWFAAAPLPQRVFDEYNELAYRTCGETIPFLTGFGATETAPHAMGRMWPTEDVSNMGLPPPGVEAKLVPIEGKLEMRVKGPGITPGYWRQPELTARAFDEEGYYRLGDAFVFADEKRPEAGLLFRGRIAEDFKLTSGTFVHVGPLRVRLIEHLAPLARDVVIAGEGRDEVGALIFPNGKIEADVLKTRLASFPSTGSSNRIGRAMVLEEPPSLDAGEMTDKGSLNQRAVLARRAALVEELYRDPPSARTICI
ncbi:MAG TPA: feruloyl-CoA synthase [Burkholderiales bacterium]|nr:feruloyl-CoA synthase [Burkholderiales bacterium]